LGCRGASGSDELRVFNTRNTDQDQFWNDVRFEAGAPFGNRSAAGLSEVGAGRGDPNWREEVTDKVSGFSFRKLSAGALVSANTVGVRVRKARWFKAEEWKVFTLKESVNEEGRRAKWAFIDSESECIAMMEVVEMALALTHEKVAPAKQDAAVKL
jgi:hypothetical protein